LSLQPGRHEFFGQGLAQHPQASITPFGIVMKVPGPVDVFCQIQTVPPMRYLIDAQVAEGPFHPGEQPFDGVCADIHTALHAGELTPPVIYGLPEVPGIWPAEPLIGFVGVCPNHAPWVNALCDHLLEGSLRHVWNHHKEHPSRFPTGRQVQFHTAKDHSLMPARRAPPEPSTSSLLLREERLVQDDRVLPWRAAQLLRAEVLDAMVVEREPDLQVHLSERLAAESCAMAGKNQLIIPKC